MFYAVGSSSTRGRQAVMGIPVPPKTVTVRSFMAAEAQIRQLTPELSRPHGSGHVNSMTTRHYP